MTRLPGTIQNKAELRSAYSAPVSKIPFDNLGMLASITCIVHCMAMPLILSSLPLIGLRFLEDDWTHKVLAGFVLVFALLAFIPGYRRHRKLSILIPASIGIAVVLFATFACEKFMGKAWEVPLISVGN